MKQLMQELIDAMIESATDKLGRGYPEWYWVRDNIFRIVTQQSRNPSRSSTGGEYFGYAHFELRPDGVEVWDSSSCELVGEFEEKARSAKIYPVSLTKEGLERMAHLAEARALTMVAPEEALDPKLTAIIEAACAMFDSPKAGISQLKEAVRAYMNWQDKKERQRLIALAEAKDT